MKLEREHLKIFYRKFTLDYMPLPNLGHKFAKYAAKDI